MPSHIYRSLGPQRARVELKPSIGSCVSEDVFVTVSADAKPATQRDPVKSLRGLR